VVPSDPLPQASFQLQNHAVVSPKHPSYLYNSYCRTMQWGWLP